MNSEFESIAENVWRAKGDAPRGESLCHPQFYCPSCGYGCDDYYSDDERQMPDNRFQFCPCCGKAVTDEAMSIVTERLRELKKMQITDKQTPAYRRDGGKE